MINKAILKDVIEKPITGEWGKEGNTVKVLRTTNFTNDGKIKFDNVVTRDIARNKTSDKRLIKGDIIIEKSGGSPTQPVGRVVFFEAEGEFLCNNFTAILRPKKELVFPKFLFYLLFTYHKYGFTGGFQNKTTGIINLQLKSYIDKTKIPLPPLETQKKIAEILDAADTLRQKTKTLIEKYDQLTQSLFLDMFGDPVSNPKNWNKKKLKDLVLRLDAGKSIQSVDAKDAGSFKVLKTSAVSWGDFRSWEAKPLPSNYIPPKNHLVRKGDLLLSRMNTTELVGASCYIHKEVSNLALPDRIWKFVWKEKNIDPLFVCHGINKLTFRNEISKISSGTSGSMKNISKEKVLNLDFIYPDYPLQNLFAETVQAIEEQKAKAQASLEKSEELFQSLLQKAFKGETN